MQQQSFLQLPYQQVFVNQTPVHHSWVTEIVVWEINAKSHKISAVISIITECDPEKDDYFEFKNAFSNGMRTENFLKTSRERPAIRG